MHAAWEPCSMRRGRPIVTVAPRDDALRVKVNRAPARRFHLLPRLPQRRHELDVSSPGPELGEGRRVATRHQGSVLQGVV